MDVLISLVACVALFFCWMLPKLWQFYQKHRQWRSLFETNKVKEAGKKHWFLGHMHFLENFRQLYERMQECVAETNTKLVGVWIGRFYPIIFAVHPDSAKVLLKSTEPKPTYDGSGYGALRSWIGDGLLTSKGKKWERNRRLLTPAFHFEVLRPYVGIYNNVIDVMLKKFAQDANNKAGTEIYNPISLAAFESILHCAVSYEMDVQGTNSSDPYVMAVQKLGHLTMDRLIHVSLHWTPIYKMSQSGREYFKNVTYVHEFDEKVIKKRQRELEQGVKPTKKHLDFLDILLSARDSEGQGLSFQEIRDEVDTFLFEGHDTTASALAWAIYSLAIYPEQQEMVFQEVKSIMGKRQEVQYEDLQKLKYLNMFLKESMRVNSPVPAISRLLTSDTEIDGAMIPANTEVWIPIHVINNRNDVWENPNKFDPLRFKDHDGYDPYAFVPFSAGSRNCIGQNFAMNELRVAMMKTVMKFVVKPVPEKVPIHYPDLVMRSEFGIYVTFEPRE